MEVIHVHVWKYGSYMVCVGAILCNDADNLVQCAKVESQDGEKEETKNKTWKEAEDERSSAGRKICMLRCSEIMKNYILLFLGQQKLLISWEKYYLKWEKCILDTRIEIQVRRQPE